MQLAFLDDRVPTTLACLQQNGELEWYRYKVYADTFASDVGEVIHPL